MENYIAFLRGINVGGKNLVKMNELKTLFESLQFKNIKTYIQSGNIVFATDANDAKTLNNNIEVTLEKTFGFKIPCIIRTLNELIAITINNPFGTCDDTERLYVTLLKEKPTAEKITTLYSYKNDIDDFCVMNREVYLWCHAGYSDSKFTNNFFKAKLDTTATTRNWKTLNKMITMAQSNC